MRVGVDEISAGEAARTLTLSSYGTFLLRSLMPRFHRFRESHPDIDINFTTYNDVPDFDDRTTDLAISTTLLEKMDCLTLVPLFDEFCGSVCRPGFLSSDRTQALLQLSDVTILHTKTRLSAWADWAEAAELRGFAVNRGETFEHFYFMLQAAASGLGVAIGPHALVADDLASGQLVAPMGLVASGRRYHLSYRTSAERDSRILDFQNWLLHEVQIFENP